MVEMAAVEERLPVEPPKGGRHGAHPGSACYRTIYSIPSSNTLSECGHSSMTSHSI
jgi:hypothetical protein